jgi:SAM-dependent methyltransferase
LKGQDQGFKDHFSGHAEAYAAHRPLYPLALYEWLASRSPGLELAWDCATGNGQAARELAKHFQQVIASDASQEQIEQAVAAPGVRYCVEAAERSGRAQHSIDLITVAQAFHWFHVEAFFEEADRVLKPGGLLVVWTYFLAQVSDAVDALVQNLYEGQLGDFWPPERGYIDRGYRDFELPWTEVAVPDFEMTAEWTLEALLGYLGTWSAVRRFMDETGRNPLDDMREDFAGAWGPSRQTRTVRWPLIIRAWQKPGNPS